MTVGCILTIRCEPCAIGQHPEQRAVHPWAGPEDVAHALRQGHADPTGKPCTCWCSRPPRRIQRRRAAGWRMPEGAVYVGRPTIYGNPFPVDGDWITWAAVGIGHRGDGAGRRAAAVDLYRAWITSQPIEIELAAPAGPSVTYAEGTTVPVRAVTTGFALTAANLLGTRPDLPPRPDLTRLRGRDLVCWCREGDPCHGDVQLELANGDT